MKWKMQLSVTASIAHHITSTWDGVLHGGRDYDGSIQIWDDQCTLLTSYRKASSISVYTSLLFPVPRSVRISDHPSQRSASHDVISTPYQRG